MTLVELLRKTQQYEGFNMSYNHDSKLWTAGIWVENGESIGFMVIGIDENPQNAVMEFLKNIRTGLEVTEIY